MKVKKITMEKLYERDRADILKYVVSEPEFNLFIIGDIENYGVDSKNVEVFAKRQGGSYDSLVLRYLQNYVVYSRTEDYNAEELAGFFKSGHIKFISGKGSVLARLSPYFSDKEAKNTYLSKLSDVSMPDGPSCGAQVRSLAPEDAACAVDLFSRIDEFDDCYRNQKQKEIEGIRLNLLSGGAGFGAFLDGRLVATAFTAAENSMSAMIIGVATLPEYRKQGLASNLVAALCKNCLEKGMRFLCLFYDNPKAGKIYRRLGFREMGTYTILK